MPRASLLGLFGVIAIGSLLGSGFLLGTVVIFGPLEAEAALAPTMPGIGEVRCNTVEATTIGGEHW